VEARIKCLWGVEAADDGVPEAREAAGVVLLDLL
jgi:hypothetical protein